MTKPRSLKEILGDTKGIMDLVWGPELQFNQQTWDVLWSPLTAHNSWTEDLRTDPVTRITL